MNISIKSGKQTITLHEADKRKLSGTAALLRSIAVNTENAELSVSAQTAKEAIEQVLVTLCERNEVDTPRETTKVGAA